MRPAGHPARRHRPDRRRRQDHPDVSPGPGAAGAGHRGGDHHHQDLAPAGIAVAQDPDTAREILARGGLVCLGVPSAQGKLVSPGFEGWDALADYTLVEADGSAGKPFKGHEKHEPVLPPRRNTTILVLGADGFGRPISVAAHRPALYARLAGVPENRPVTPAIAARVAAREGFHDQVFVNQVDQEEERPLARQLAERLDCPVAAGSLRSGCWEKIK